MYVTLMVQNNLKKKNNFVEEITDYLWLFNWEIDRLDFFDKRNNRLSDLYVHYQRSIQLHTEIR